MLEQQCRHVPASLGHAYVDAVSGFVLVMMLAAALLLKDLLVPLLARAADRIDPNRPTKGDEVLIVDGKGKFGKLKDGVEGCLVEQGPLVRGASAKHAAAAYCCTVTYDFKEAGDADAFLSGYSSDSDGFAVTAGAEGCHINKLMRFTNTMAESTGTRVGFYQEWESKELQLKYAAQRAESGFECKAETTSGVPCSRPDRFLAKRKREGLQIWCEAQKMVRTRNYCGH